jgi:Tocopherol cyclase
MATSHEAFLQHINDARYHAQPEGHYESFFLRANHPSRPLAFWIRYTLFSPAMRPEEAAGELWAIYFNGETMGHVVVKRVVTLNDCLFNSSAFEVRIADALLCPGLAQGSLSLNGATITWNLTYQPGDEDPLLFLPLHLYTTGLPAAKSVVGAPLATFQGTLVVNGETIQVNQWVGSQNHNWGSKHTDQYAWGQVAGFDTHPGSVLEVATARLKVGPIWSPPLTLLVLRHEGKEWALNSIAQSLRASGSFTVGQWSFHTQSRDVSITGSISAPGEAFVGLRYSNPPGGTKDCLNTKLASCQVQIAERGTNRPETLSTRHRAAFEILTDARRHPITIRV